MYWWGRLLTPPRVPKSHFGRRDPSIPCRELPLKRSIWTTPNLTLDDVIPAYHAGSCLSSGHFGRRNPSMPCRKVPLKWSFWTTKSQHTMRGAASQAVTLDDVMPAYHAGSCLSGGYLVEHPRQHPPRAHQTAPNRPSSWPHHGEQCDPLATKGLRNAPRPVTLSCLSAITCVSFIRYLAWCL